MNKMPHRLETGEFSADAMLRPAANIGLVFAAIKA
jgi:hypothetical protein